MINTIRGKCLVLGNCAVGKSAFINSFLSDSSQFMKNYMMTLGIDIHQKQIRIPDTDTCVQLFFFDCSGKEFYKSLILHMCEQASLIFLVYDVTSESSFKAVEPLYNMVQTNNRINGQIRGVLLGNKVDLVNRRRVSPKAGHELAQKLGLTYFEGSAKEQAGIEAPFFYLANEWFNMYTESAQMMKTLQ